MEEERACYTVRASPKELDTSGTTSYQNPKMDRKLHLLSVFS